MLKIPGLFWLAGFSIEDPPSHSSRRQKYLDQGERLLAAHRSDEAERAFEKLAQLDPPSQPGPSHTDLREERKVIDVAKELNRVYPEDVKVVYHTGRLFGNYACLAIRRLSEVAPASDWKQQAAGETYESQGYDGLGIAEYRAVFALSLGPVRLLRWRQVNSQPENLAESSRQLDQELRLDPTNANGARLDCPGKARLTKQELDPKAAAP